MTTDPVYDAAQHEAALTKSTKHYYDTLDALTERVLANARKGDVSELAEALATHANMFAALLVQTPLGELIARKWAEDNIAEHL